MRIDLPGDGWAELREPSDLRAKDKIAVQRAMVFSLLGNQENGDESRIPGCHILVTGRADASDARCY
jgi:hypothetical protein